MDTINETLEQSNEIKQENEYIPAYNLDEAKGDFDKIGIVYNMKSVVYLKRKGLSFSQMIEYDEYNTILMIASGLDAVNITGKGNNEDKAIEILDEWLNKGYTLKTAYIFAFERAKKAGFFTTVDEILLMKEKMKETEDTLTRAVIMNTTLRSAM